MGFDWQLVSDAAEKWMAENPERLPAWLVLPADTPNEIVAMAQEIYDVPTILDDIEIPWFTTIKPADIDLSTSAPEPERLDPMGIPTAPGSRFRQKRLLDAAQQGTLTAEDIRNMSMEEYAQVRGLLLNSVRNHSLKDIKRL